MTDTLKKFTPNDISRAKYKLLAERIKIKYMEEFFDLWESQGDGPDAAHEAGTMVCHALLEMGARVAVFGAVCSNHEPEINQWRAVVDEHFNNAVRDVAASFAEASAEAVDGT
jgi:hypothetical protein